MSLPPIRGDGITDDTEAIRLALQESGGPRLYLPRGLYLVNELPLVGRGLYGDGTLKKSQDSPHGVHLLGDCASVDGLEFRSSVSARIGQGEIKVGDGARFARVVNCRFNGLAYCCITTDDEELSYRNPVDGALFTGNLFAGSYSRHMMLSSVRGVTIATNILRDSNCDSIRLRQNDGDCLVLGNQFTNIGKVIEGDKTTRDALDCCWAGRRLDCSHNMVNGVAKCGFDIKSGSPGTDSTTSFVRCCDNTVSGAGYGAIVVTDEGTGPIRHVHLDGNMALGCCLIGGEASIVVKKAAVEDLWLCGNHVMSEGAIAAAYGIYVAKGNLRAIVEKNFSDRRVVNLSATQILKQPTLLV